MMNLPGNLIGTVGTSLFYPNLEKLSPETLLKDLKNGQNAQIIADREALGRCGLLSDWDRLKALLTEIKSAHMSKMHGKLADLLTRLPPEMRLLGAEINSIEAMVRKNFLPTDRHRLILFVSDTQDGESIGKILTQYFQNPNCPIRFEHCQSERISGLQDEKPLVFQKEGLPNLVRQLGDHYRKWGHAIAINATGGYKAQIALAVAFGQATGAPVYYKHERFDQIIRFPKIPFTIDLSLVADNLKLWADLAEPGATFDRQTIDQRLPEGEAIREAVLPLLESVEEDKIALFNLSALGMVYWEAFLTQNPQINLEPSRVKTRKGCNFRDDHYPVGFKEYVQRFYDAFPAYVHGCHSLPYSGQAAIQNRFYFRGTKIIGEYLDNNRFGGRFEVMTTAENELERAWLVDVFEKFRNR